MGQFFLGIENIYLCNLPVIYQILPATRRSLKYSLMMARSDCFPCYKFLFQGPYVKMQFLHQLFQQSIQSVSNINDHQKEDTKGSVMNYWQIVLRKVNASYQTVTTCKKSCLVQSIEFHFKNPLNFYTSTIGQNKTLMHFHPCMLLVHVLNLLLNSLMHFFIILDLDDSRIH